LAEKFVEMMKNEEYVFDPKTSLSMESIESNFLRSRGFPLSKQSNAFLQDFFQTTPDEIVLPSFVIPDLKTLSNLVWFANTSTLSS